MRGVEAVVKLDNAVAVVADRFWRAKRGAEALKIEWDPGAGAGSRQRAIRQGLSRRARRPGGDGAQRRRCRCTRFASRRAPSVIEALYEVPYLAHATDGAAQRHRALSAATGSTSGSARRTRYGTLQHSPPRPPASSRRRSLSTTAFCGGGFGRRSVNDEMRPGDPGLQGRSASRSS